MIYDVVIIGGGPAGLAAAQRLNQTTLNTLMIDAGSAISTRDSEGEAELTQGHGGAGLYSDGKFSFFPSASALWELPNEVSLRSAYNWTCATLNAFGLDTPPMPESPTAFAVGSGEWVLKDYPSDYMPLSSRLRLTADLVGASSAKTLNNVRITSYRYAVDDDLIHLSAKDLKSGEEKAIIARRLIVASGRFGPLDITRGEKNVFQRLEVGFRIEQAAETAFFAHLKQLDPKLKFRSADGRLEWRTFCACRNGETVFTRTLGLWTVSGHSDGPATGRSNVGFNTRILDQQLAADALRPLIAKLQDPACRFDYDILAVLNDSSLERRDFNSLYGEQLATQMIAGLQALIQKFPSITDERTRLIGPTLEGVGWYPELNEDLRIPDTPVWVAGDACGRFRGIVAAMISGFYAADAIATSLEVNNPCLHDMLRESALVQ